MLNNKKGAQNEHITINDLFWKSRKSLKSKQDRLSAVSLCDWTSEQ